MSNAAASEVAGDEGLEPVATEAEAGSTEEGRKHPEHRLRHMHTLTHSDWTAEYGRETAVILFNLQSSLVFSAFFKLMCRIYILFLNLPHSDRAIVFL